MLFGTKKADIGVEEVLLHCPSCEGATKADVMVSTLYYHIWWIPMCPTGKLATIICSECGLKRVDIPLEKNIISNYKEIRSKFRNPLYTYFGVAFFLFLAIYAYFDSRG